MATGMETIVMAAGMIAAFIAGAYIRKPFAFIKKNEPERAVEVERIDPEVEKAARRINDQINQMMMYTGPKRGDGK